MSIQGIQGTSDVYRPNDDDHAHGAATVPQAPREFDFSGGAYVNATLPTGLIATHSTTVSAAAITRDMAELEDKLHSLKQALLSPQVREALAKNGQALYTLTKLEGKIGTAVIAIAVLKQTGVAAMSALAVADKVFSGGNALLSLPGDLATFASQFKEALPTIGAAGAPILAATLEVAKAAAKLNQDLVGR